jgi:hypothetical protein
MVGGIQVEHDQRRRWSVRLQEHVDEQALDAQGLRGGGRQIDGVRIVADFVIARRGESLPLLGRVLQTGQRQ